MYQFKKGESILGDLLYYEFDSIAEFLNYIENAPTNIAVWCDPQYLASMEGNYDFCQTNSLEEAISYCRFGTHPDIEKLEHLNIELNKYLTIDNHQSRKRNYYVGYAPNVKAYLEGNPLAMYCKKNPQRKHIHIYYNTSVSAFVSKKQILHRGVITINLVEMLEMMGYSVSLHLFNMGFLANQVFYTNFLFKKSGERLNVRKLYFPLCHPSFLRRLVFRLNEVTPNIMPAWPFGYGYPCTDEMVREQLKIKKQDIVINKPDVMNVFGKNLFSDAEAMMEYIDKQTDQEHSLKSFQKRR